MKTLLLQERLNFPPEELKIGNREQKKPIKAWREAGLVLG
jgi:hypothetical protein